MEQILTWVVENWGIVTTVVVALLTSLGVFKKINKAKFLGIWELIDDVILILTSEKSKPEEQLKVREVMQGIRESAGVDKIKKKAYKTIEKSAFKNEEVVSKVLETRKYMRNVGEVYKDAKKAYKLFKGFTKLF